jgi:hypothetical protein
MFELMLPAMAVGTLCARATAHVWAKNVKPQLLLAMSAAFGTLLSAIFCFAILIVWMKLSGGVHTFSAAVVIVVIAAIVFGPTLIILGPIVVVGVVQAGHGRIFLPSYALYGLSAFCILLQYSLLGLLLSE